MSHLYDRKTARPLTIPELWTCWDIMLDDSSREAKLIQGTLGKDSLPKEALNDETTYNPINGIGDRNRKNQLYPIIRTDHDLQYDNTLIDLQNKRSFRLIVIRDVFFLPGGSFEGHLPRRFVVRKIWQEYHEPEWTNRKFPIKMIGADNHREGIHIDALHGYATAWSHMLPYHLDAFPATHEARRDTAVMECKIFNNIMATILDMIKNNEHRFKKAKKLKLLDIGQRAGMSILGIRFAIDVGSLQRALRRLAQIKSMIDELDTDKTLTPMKKELRKLQDDLIKYCKNRDPDDDLLKFDYKSHDSNHHNEEHDHEEEEHRFEEMMRHFSRM
ncbi:uncharacterized protein I303_106287 [Kwoniella dejecticola CBS 10117]|uniref:Uncharacterized protein n=1 Tax=Kwoniella dejecticola CBS 10117 TaxID=1296121 RepID=A0A1A6A1U3_9TREE|nr:uncharacterized protein I303_06306 [Kwoniella dejecticola CBS 10117]OBR84019.1 hypothetical protein I303_06306 [Kwoniella dejecticola CBS 10117]